MKRFLPLLFLLACFTAVSQPLRKGSHVILIRNLANWRLQRIDEKSNISVVTTSGKIISGEIRLIRADTIFFADTLIRLSDIFRIYYKSIFAFDNNPQYDEKRPVYESEKKEKEFICPPDSVYRSSWKYSVYIRHLTTKIRNQKLALQNPLVYKNFLKWNLTKIAHLELGISYERVIAKNLSWETEISGILGIPSSYFSLINYPVFNYNGISITTYPKYYFIPRTYISFVFMYRYLWVDGMKCNWPRGGSGTEFKSQQRNDYGLSIRIGFMRRYGKTVFDYYVGGGIKYITTHDLVYGYYPEDSGQLDWIDRQGHSPKVYNKNLFGPVINIGIKIGGAFGH